MNQNFANLWLMLCLAPLFVSLLGGCASKLLVQQDPKLTGIDPGAGYRFDLLSKRDNSDSLFISMSFSGGGTRAAALAFGVLEALRDHQITWKGQRKRVLDEIDVISSVSGGSFTAAYFGLYGERIFDDFETKFLKRNVQAQLLAELLSPINLVRLGSPYFDRIHIAAEYYDREIFGGQTYKSLIETGRKPYVVINATDLDLQSRFEFTQQQFDEICYDLSTIPIAVAVAASSAYPVLLSPMTLENQRDKSGCGGTPNLTSIKKLKYEEDPSAYRTTIAEQHYRDYENTKYIHLIDGGLSENLGLGKTTDAIGGRDSEFAKRMEPSMKTPQVGFFPLHFKEEEKKTDVELVIIVNAGTGNPDSSSIGKTRHAPGSLAVAQGGASAAIRNASQQTLTLVQEYAWPRAERRGDISEEQVEARNLCEPGQWRPKDLKQEWKRGEWVMGQEVDPLGRIKRRIEQRNRFVVEITFDRIVSEETKKAVNALGTNFFLAAEDVDRLRKVGRELLDKSDEWCRFLLRVDVESRRVNSELP